jgi:hypothetical protein
MDWQKFFETFLDYMAWGGEWPPVDRLVIRKKVDGEWVVLGGD